MVQRIQTIYLLLVVILSSVLLFVPIAGWIIDNTVYELAFTGVYTDGIDTSYMQVWGLSILTAIIPLISLSSIFLYKKRILQVRFNVFNMLLMVGYYGLLFLYIWLGTEKLHAEDWFIEIISSFPLVNIILSALAIRSILRDEALIRSLNRIR